MCWWAHELVMDLLYHRSKEDDWGHTTQKFDHVSIVYSRVFMFFFFFWNVEFSKQNLNYIGVVCKTQLVLTTGLNPSKDQAAWWLPMEFWQCWACLSWCWGKFVWILGGDKASWWLGFTRIKSNGFENNCCPRGGGRKRVWLLAIFGSMIGLTNLGPTGLL